MSRIDELIAELCPEGVEYGVIGDICKINRGRVMSKDYLRKHVGEYPVYSSQTANEGIFGFINTYDYDIECITWTTDGANAGSVFYHRDKKFSITNVCGLLKVLDNSQLSTRFLYYILGQFTKRHVNEGMGNPKLMSNAMSKICIPVPPLEVQHEIVKVLDTFTKLEAEMETELEAELEMRRRQYQYHRDALLSFDEAKQTVKWATMGEIGKFIRGSGIQKADFVESGVGCIHYGQIHTHYGTWAKTTKSFVKPEFAARLRKARAGDLVITTTSEDDEAVAKAVAWLGDEDVAVSTDTYIFRHSLNPKYVSYFFQTELFRSQKKSRITGTKVRRISGESLAKIRIPIPPFEVQREIVAILDKFDALVNNLSSYLPAEIAARRQQYEYYRDRLLTFKEAA